MDRFKFRAYIQKYNKLVDVYNFGLDMGVCQWVWHSNIYDTPDGKPVLDYWGSVDERFSNIINKTKLSDCILEQCTGLKDKNGKLIYEHDYVMINKIIYEVFWNKTKISLANILNDDIIDFVETEEMEIIGNEHEETNIRKI